ncbi:MAG: McrC family protein, partial [Campylobacterales bacterium]
SKKVEFFSLGGQNNQLDEDLIWYQIDSIKHFSRTQIIDKATFFTSHYIGFYSTVVNEKTVNIIIEPRFGDGIFNYLLSYAYGIYLPKGTSSSYSDKSGSLWLIALMWKATLEKAMTKSQIPKEYQKQSKNLDTFKGQLNISKHIQHNLFDKSRFYCDYRKLTMDTAINQTIRHTYKLLEKKGYGDLLKDIAEYDQMLQSFGVQSKTVSPNDIKKIRYSKLNIYYKKVMELSSLIIKNQSKSSNHLSHSNDSFSYFLDIAELWENYLLKVLQKNLPQYYIYSPNENGGISLFEDGSREIRPDIIIEKDAKTVAVLDAKYKWYKQIGKNGNSDYSVSRDDLYQMTTYLYHYGKENLNIVGFFISPIEQSIEAPKVLKNNLKHKIKVVNLDIEQFKKPYNTEGVPTDFSIDKIKSEEKNFIKNIEGILNDPI